MKKISILTFLALFAATLIQQGAAWAQEVKGQNWGQVPTATSEWTHITAGSTTGFELKDDYYYVSENLTFTNTIGGAGQGSGMYVQAGREVYLYIPAGVTLTAIGANADGTTGAGAGILLPSTSTLHIIGGGTIVATGGNAANGQDGFKGSDAIVDEESVETWFLGKKLYCGVGGEGGYGGGGAGAGIGTAGANGGLGGPTIGLDDDNRPQSYEDWEGGDIPGLDGQNGYGGASALAMGTLYIQSTITKQISGGAKGNGGAAGGYGKCITTGGDFEFQGIEVYNIAGVPIPVPEFDLTDYQAISGGGGGGGGAGGGSAQPIGTGGAGGGGGASGACGSACAQSAWLYSSYGTVGAGGGAGGIGTDGNNGENGCRFLFISEDESPFNDPENDIKDGGTGGDPGTASVAGSAGAIEPPYYADATAPQYTVSYYTLGVTPSKASETYNVGSGTTITLPTLSGDNNHVYKWILSIHGHAAGTTTSHCAAPNTDVYSPGDEVNLSNIYGAIEFCAIYAGCVIDCKAHIEDYTQTLWANWAVGDYAIVSLQNRKLYKDGYWNTLTLPFSLTKKELASTCLAGAEIRTFTDTEWNATTRQLKINFSDDTNKPYTTENEANALAITAGVPCIIRWGTPGNATGDVINDPLFKNVKVDITDQTVFYDGIDEDTQEPNPYETESHGVRFQALIAPWEVEANSYTLLLGAKNKLYSHDPVWVHATHAYFEYFDDQMDDWNMSAHEIVIDFGGDEQITYINDITVNDNRQDNVKEGIFNLNGQRLDAPHKGINIINGRKVVIK